MAERNIVTADTGNSKAPEGSHGFSIIELVAAISIMLIIASIAVPSFLTVMHAARLRGAVTDFASLLQAARIRAVDDNRYYSIYVLGGNPPEGFVDIYPQLSNGTSGSGGTAIATNDPIIVINAEISQQPVGAAPNTASLQAQVLPANSPLTPNDGISTTLPITFGPRGLPCKPLAGVCDSLGGPQAYWTFFQDNVTQSWGAVTVTPAGRIQRWIFTGGAQGTWASY